MHPLIMALDANRDGEISAEEIENAAAALKKLDKNGDGKLTRAELRPAGAPEFGGPGRGGFGQGGGPGGPGAAGFVERLMGFDADKDGKVTKQELPERMQRIFERGDLNRDAAIDKEEAEKLASQFGQARGARGGGAGGTGGGRPDGEPRPRRPE